MAVAVKKSTLKRMSIEEFLAWDSGDDLRYELVGGWPVAQSALSRSHGRMDVNVGAGLRNRLKAAGRPCVVESGSALRIDNRWTVRAPRPAGPVWAGSADGGRADASGGDTLA